MSTLESEGAALAGLGDHPDLPIDGTRIVGMPAALSVAVGSRIQAITLGRTIFVRPDLLGAVLHGEQPELLAHELIHVSQWRRLGPSRFLIDYASDYFRLRLLGLGHDAAYRNIGLEFDAYVAARHIVQ